MISATYRVVQQNNDSFAVEVPRIGTLAVVTGSKPRPSQDFQKLADLAARATAREVADAMRYAAAGWCALADEDAARQTGSAPP